MLADKSESGAFFRKTIEKRQAKMVALCSTDEERAAMEVHLAESSRPLRDGRHARAGEGARRDGRPSAHPAA